MTLLKNYAFPIILLSSISAGAVVGLFLGKSADAVKPVGDLFLNLLFTAVVPVVFFSIASSIAAMTNLQRLGKILGYMMLVFVATGVIASVVMLVGITLFPPADGVSIQLAPMPLPKQDNLLAQIVSAFTVSDFGNLLSKKNMLALIVFAVLTGLATASVGESGKAFATLLLAGNEVMMKLIRFVMYLAPVGLAAYFAWLTGAFGQELLGSMARAMALYYPVSLLYFVVGFSLYALWAGGSNALKRFWQNIVPPMLVGLGTGSSIAAIPANLDAAAKSGVPKDVRDIVIPIGATIHMDGSCLSAILKIALLYAIYERNLYDPVALLTAIGVALLSGMVMSGVPGGGYIGEVLIISLYGFPPETLPILTLIGTLVDPIATMVNSIGDNVASMMVAKLVGGGDSAKNFQETPTSDAVSVEQ